MNRKSIFIFSYLLIISSCISISCNNCIVNKKDREESYIQFKEKKHSLLLNNDIKGYYLLLNNYKYKTDKIFSFDIADYFKFIGDFNYIEKNMDSKYLFAIFFTNSLNLFNNKNTLKSLAISKKHSNLEKDQWKDMTLVLWNINKDKVLSKDRSRRYKILLEYKNKGSITDDIYVKNLLLGKHGYISNNELFIYKYLTNSELFFENIRKSADYEKILWADLFFYYTFINESNKCLEMIEDIPQYHQPVIIRKIRNKIFEEKYDEAMKMIFENKDRYPDNKTFGYYENLIRQRIEKEKGK